MGNRGGGRRERLLVVALAVAIATILLGILLLPRPDVRVVAFQVESGPCNPATSTRLASAIYTLENRGGADGTVIVEVLADGRWLGTTWHRVPSGARTTHRVSVPVPDCDFHLYSYGLCYPNADVGTGVEQHC